MLQHFWKWVYIYIYNLQGIKKKSQGTKITSQDNTFESHGNSFFHGVRFSVQTNSLGKAACLNNEEFVPAAEVTPSLVKESLGLVVVLLSMKFREAQNWPDNAWVSPDQFSSTLQTRAEKKSRFFTMFSQYWSLLIITTKFFCVYVLSENTQVHITHYIVHVSVIQNKLHDL